MRRVLLISALTVFGWLFSPNVSAQDWQQKAIRSARKEAKQLTKEGFTTLPGKLPVDRQLENAWQKQLEVDAKGDPHWYVASARTTGSSQSAAVSEATNMARADLAGRIQSGMTEWIKAKGAQHVLEEEEMTALTEEVNAGKDIIANVLDRTIPLVEVYRTLSDSHVEVMVTLGYCMESAHKVAAKAIRKELAKQSKVLAEAWDKLGYPCKK